MSRAPEQRLRDILEAIDAIDRADMVLRAHGPEDPIALLALDAG